MKVKPGDLIIDKNLNRTLTVLSVNKTVYASYGSYKMEYDMIQYMDSTQSQGTINTILDYELDAWRGIQLIPANE